MPRTTSLLICVAGLLASSWVAAAGDPGSDRAVIRSARLETIAADAVEHGYPGMVIALSTAEGLYAGAAGLADRAAGKAMTPRSRLHAASTTKAVTAAAILMLVDRGRLSLDDTLTDLLSPNLVSGISGAGEITVRHLLLHTSGLYSPNNDARYLARYIGPDRKHKPFWSPREIVAFAAQPANPPAFPPGEGSRYSDVNYVLLSLVVGEVSGEPFKAFVTREIFQPLGMDNSWFLSDAPDRERARGYSVESRILRQIGLDPALKADEDGLIDTTDAQEQSDGAAGIITTVPELARFARALTQGDLLSDESRAFLLAVADKIGTQDHPLGVLRAYDLGYGPIVTAEGDGPGINILWALHLPSGRIVAAAVNQFGAFNESDYLLETVVPAALNINLE